MAITRELPVLGSKAWSFDDFATPLAPSLAAQLPHQRKPEWIRVRPPAGENFLRIRDLMRSKGLHTVCEEARCPNVAECWQSGTATFLIGGDICTRACRFCAVKTARRPPPLDPEEPQKIADNVASMGLRYVVLTSVDRDDLEDQGAHHFAATIVQLKRNQPDLLVEALVPDFRGEPQCIEAIVASGLDVYAHNVETVRRLQLRVRDPRAGYEQSLLTLREAKRLAEQRGQKLVTKSSIMLGLGETQAELLETFRDLRAVGVDVLTLGQYLRPTAEHLPVEEFVTPERFKHLESLGLAEGFAYVAAGPMVRSSYKAAEFFVESMLRNDNHRGDRTHGV